MSGEYWHGEEEKIARLEESLKREVEMMKARPMVMVPGVHSKTMDWGIDQAVYRGPSPPRVYNYQEKMEMRMNWQPGRIPNCFAFVEYRMVGEKAFMWVLTNDAQSVVLEDEAALFPSDALITKVRMMVG